MYDFYLNSYEKRKAAARETAVEWQLDFDKHDYTYGELAEFTEYFTKLAKRYGLTKEFKENGII